MLSFSHLKRGFLTPSEHYIKPIPQRPAGIGYLVGKFRDQSVAGLLIRDPVVYGIQGQQLIAGKIHLSHQPGYKGLSEKGIMNVGGTPGIVMVAPRVGARPDADKPILAFFVGHAAAGPAEVGIMGGIMPVAFVRIASGGIGLPHFNQSIGHRAAVFFQHAAGDDDALPDRFPSPARIGGQIIVARLNGIVAVDRAGQFGKGLG